jgi:hypothetical protein
VKCKGLAVRASAPASGTVALRVAAVKGRKSVTLGKLTRKASAGSLRLVFKVKKGTKARKLYRAVKKARARKLRLAITFSPAGGTPAKLTRTIALNPR